MTFLLCIDCGSSKIENRELGLCATHNKERRDKENARPKVVKPVKKVSEKQADNLKEYSKLRKQFLEFKMICEFEGCKDRSTQIHHCSKNAKNFLNTDTWLAVCATHHNFIEREMPAEERRLKGLLTD